MPFGNNTTTAEIFMGPTTSSQHANTMTWPQALLFGFLMVVMVVGLEFWNHLTREHNAVYHVMPLYLNRLRRDFFYYAMIFLPQLREEEITLATLRSDGFVQVRYEDDASGVREEMDLPDWHAVMTSEMIPKFLFAPDQSKLPYITHGSLVGCHRLTVRHKKPGEKCWTITVKKSLFFEIGIEDSEGARVYLRAQGMPAVEGDHWRNNDELEKMYEEYKESQRWQTVVKSLWERFLDVMVYRTPFDPKNAPAIVATDVQFFSYEAEELMCS